MKFKIKMFLNRFGKRTKILDSKLIFSFKRGSKHKKQLIKMKCNNTDFYNIVRKLEQNFCNKTYI